LLLLIQMSSSQGPNNVGGPPYPNGTTTGYPFNTKIIRDGSDWTSYIKQTRMAQNYVDSNTTDNKTPLAWWEKYGNNFRLDYFNGLRKCVGIFCPAGAFNGGPVGTVPAPPPI
jgi:hypothetical protein